MSVTDWKPAGTTANVDRDGKDAWGNTDNVKTDDTDFSIVLIAKGVTYSDWLRLTNFFTTGDIPAGATINGIEVQYKRLASVASWVNDSMLKLRKTSGQVGDNKASATPWAVSKETVTYPATGGETDTWNSGLTAADLVDSGFGIDLSALNNDTENIRSATIYFCQIRVYYTALVTFQPWAIIM